AARARLVGAEIHAAVDLHRVEREQVGGELLGDLERDALLARGGGADEQQERARVAGHRAAAAALGRRIETADCSSRRCAASRRERSAGVSSIATRVRSSSSTRRKWQVTSAPASDSAELKART